MMYAYTSENELCMFCVHGLGEQFELPSDSHFVKF